MIVDKVLQTYCTLGYYLRKIRLFLNEVIKK